MEITEKSIRDNFAKNLRAVEYVAEMNKYFDSDPAVLQVPLAFFYDVLHSGRFKGSRLLEIGSGAVVHNIALATAFFPNIIMSDYVENNLEELKRWLDGKTTLKQFLDIPAELEGYAQNLEAGKQMLEDRIRQNVKQVVRCDVLSDNIFLEEVKPEVAPPYDLIFSSLCLEGAAPDLVSFVNILKRVSNLLRPGGGLILVGFLEGASWSVLDQSNFHYLNIKEEEIKKALRESGFGNVDMKIHRKLNVEYEHKNFYCLAAEKI